MSVTMGLVLSFMIGVFRFGVPDDLLGFMGRLKGLWCGYWMGLFCFLAALPSLGSGWRRLGEYGFGVGVCGKFLQQFLVVLGLFHQLGCGGSQVVHVFGREVEAGGDVQHFVAQRGRRQVFEVEADEGEADSVAALLVCFVTLIDKGAEAAQGFLGVLVDGMLMMAVTTSRNPGTAAVLSILLLIWFWALTLMTTMWRRLRLRICCSNTLSG